MKKFVSLCMAFVLVLSLCACGDKSFGNLVKGDKSDEKPDVSSNVDGKGSVDDGKISSDDDPGIIPNEPDKDVEPLPSFDGEHVVDIKDAVVTIDWDGKTVMIIPFEWTNTTASATSVSDELWIKAFQDGVELIRAYFFEVEGYDDDMDTKSVQPGETITVNMAYELTSDMSVVEFEIEPFHGGGIIASKEFDPGWCEVVQGTEF